ncbi:MAG: T9SS type A sorting domain-containing protein [Bacteroidales bacterium]|nr:T9SS type A sorting domain-containing protein [Bacteroidales bacterium]
MKKLIIIPFLAFCYTSFAVNITNFQFTKSTYEKFEKAEATFKLSINYSNPYNPDKVTADAIITTPSSAILTVPCFYFVPVKITTNYGGNEDPAKATWMMRFAPMETGTYSVQIKVADTTGGTYYSSTLNINVIAGNRKGFVKIDNNNKQFLRFDNGAPYYPVGFNLCWNDGSGADSYNAYMTKMGNNKVTWMRYWLCDFLRQALEWSPTHWSGWYKGLGKYCQKTAALLDSTLNLCEAKGIYMQLVMQHHGQFSTTVNAEWNDNPYKTSNGGFLTNAGDFFTNAQAKLQTKKQYRYIVARWGYSTNILCWEFFNEVNLTDGTGPNIAGWHKEMNNYVKSLDVHQHITTTSITGDDAMLEQIDDSTTLTQLQYHVYQDYLEKALHLSSERVFSKISKPVMCGEFGTNVSYDNCLHPDSWGDHIRKAEWIGMMTEAPNLFWYWDTYIECKNLYSTYKILGDFLNGVDIVQEMQGNYQSFKYSNAVMSPTTLTAVGGLGWVPSMQDSFVVDAQGNFPGIENLSTFIHGTAHASMGRKSIFTLTFSANGTAYLDASGTYSSPQTIQVYIDGNLTTTYTVPQTGGTFSVPVSAGTHKIKYYNTGTDWVNVSSYRFYPVAIPSTITYGYSKNKNAYGYIYDQTYGQWADSSAVSSISGIILKIGPLDAGNYKVDFVNPQTGVSNTSPSVYTASNDTITVALPDFKKDLAFKVYDEGAVGIKNLIYQNNNIKVFPNPANTQITIELPQVTKQSTIIIYNINGQELIKAKGIRYKAKVDISNFPSGIYFIKVVNENGVRVGKFVKTSP